MLAARAKLYGEPYRRSVTDARNLFSLARLQGCHAVTAAKASSQEGWETQQRRRSSPRHIRAESGDNVRFETAPSATASVSTRRHSPRHTRLEAWVVGRTVSGHSRCMIGDLLTDVTSGSKVLASWRFLRNEINNLQAEVNFGGPKYLAKTQGG